MTQHLDNDHAITHGELLLFRTLWNTSNDNMFIVRRCKSGDYVVEKCNRSMEKTFDFRPNQLDGVFMKDILDPHTHDKIAARYDKCIAENSPISYEEEHVIDETGERVWNTTILPVIDDQAEVVRIFGVSSEVTTLKNAEKALMKMNESLEAKVNKRTQELQEALEEMERISVLDKLTQLYNRHKLDEVLEQELETAARYNSPFGVILLDLDDFKDINDQYGHRTGDAVLQELAALLKRHSRKTDTVGRWGGEEFLLIAPQTSETALASFADSLRETIQNHPFQTINGLTASFGITTYRADDASETIITRADEALYESKNRGRNRTRYK